MWTKAGIMARVELNGLDDLNAAFGRIADIPWDVTEKALNAMAEAAAEKIKTRGESLHIRDPESNVHILDKIKPAKAKKTDAGGYQDITFSGTRTRGKSKTRNAEIAFINEYGKTGQPARPFMGPAMEENTESIADPGLDIVGDWIENQFSQ